MMPAAPNGIDQNGCYMARTNDTLWQRSESLKLNIVHSNASISHSRTYHAACAVTKMR